MIEVKNVTKKYGDFVALNNVSFKVNDGEILGFLGPNGAGKTTTMNIITGYAAPTEGTVVVNGFDVLTDEEKVKAQIGYMPENVPVYENLKVREFISFVAELRKVEKAKRKEEVKKVIKDTGLEDVSGKLIRNLSRGYRQRVALAAALVGSPKVLVLDEPTVGLDPKQITDIRALIKGLAKEHTVILSSHILSEVAQICSRVVIIYNGEILAEDTPSNLEKITRESNSISVTVEDPKGKFVDVVENLSGVEKVKKVKKNLDGTYEYLVVSNTKEDIRKTLLKTLQKEDITLYELKNEEFSLEDAFIKIVDSANKKESKTKTKEKGGKK